MTDWNQRYLNACHAMQSGVALEQGLGSEDGTSKHLRVGVNSALVNDAALLGLLIKKGIINMDEYLEALTLQMEAEVATYENRLTQMTGKIVHLE